MGTTVNSRVETSVSLVSTDLLLLPCHGGVGLVWTEGVVVSSHETYSIINLAYP